MSIVTKTGDGGTTGLYGGQRVSKDDLRICAYGEVDELNAALGAVLAIGALSENLCEQLIKIQHLLFRVGGDLATPLSTKEKQDRVGGEHVQQIEEWIIAMESALAPQRSFILPGGSPAASLLHLARTICRRAERSVIALQKKESVNLQVSVLLNRLSDYLFLLARTANHEEGVTDMHVQY